jgi:hypothetical protein
MMPLRKSISAGLLTHDKAVASLRRLGEHVAPSLHDPS